MVEIPRALRINLPARQSAFLWGPRKTGKSTYLRSAFPKSLTFDLLQTDLALELAKRPAILRERLMAAPPDRLRHPVILDEVQKVPELLDEVHWLIENRGLSFILCGSSARKLKRGGVNLLGGRAWRYEMHPLASIEVGDLDLGAGGEEPARQGEDTLPRHFTADGTVAGRQHRQLRVEM